MENTNIMPGISQLVVNISSLRYFPAPGKPGAGRPSLKQQASSNKPQATSNKQQATSNKPQAPSSKRATNCRATICPLT